MKFSFDAGARFNPELSKALAMRTISLPTAVRAFLAVLCTLLSWSQVHAESGLQTDVEKCASGSYEAKCIDADRASRLLRTPNGAFPNIVYIKSPERPCTAVLLNSEWVLTVSHCVRHRDLQNLPASSFYFGPRDISVLFGSADLTDAKQVGIDKIVLDPATAATPRDSQHYPDDGLALLHLSKPTTYTARTAIAGTYDYRPDLPGAGDAAVVGWGKFFYSERDSDTRHQRRLTVAIMDQERCNSLTASAKTSGSDGPKWICAASRYQSFEACWGFGGAPLVVPQTIAPGLEPTSSAYSVIALQTGTGSGNACFDEHYGDRLPGYYVMLGPYYHWIQDTIGPLVAPRSDGRPVLVNLATPGASSRPWMRAYGDRTSTTQTGDVFPDAPGLRFAVVPRTDAQPGAALSIPLNAAPLGAYRFVVSLQKALELQPTHAHFCGGVLISRHWILTAAHCVTDYVANPSEILVRIDRQVLSYPGGQSVRAAAIKIFPQYDRTDFPRTEVNDVALLKIEDGASSDIRTLAPLSADAEAQVLAHDRNEAYVAGWGTAGFSDIASTSDYLRDTKVPIVDNATCGSKAKYGKYGNLITEAMICAGDGTSDACQGDSGGPLLGIDNEGAFALVGLVSWAKGCAEDKFPGVYTRVSAFSSWVNQQAK